LKDQLLLLLRLQAIDARVRELRISMSALPEKLEADKQNLAKLEALIAQERARLGETEAWHKEQERLIALEEEAIKKAKIKQQSAKGSKDYTAASREIDNKRRNKSEREEEVLKVMEVLERFRTDLAGREQDLAKLREHVATEEHRVAAELAELQSEIANRSMGRDEVIAGIDPMIRKRYERTMERRGLGIVPVVNGVCQGCHMSVPPQLNNMLARFDSIETCPRCHRLLYRQELLEEPDETSE
jgi:uncharacterized protein